GHHLGICSGGTRPSGGERSPVIVPPGTAIRAPGYPHALRVVHRICGYPGVSIDGSRDDYDGPVLAQRQSEWSPRAVSTNAERLERLEQMRVMSREGGAQRAERV